MVGAAVGGATVADGPGPAVVSGGGVVVAATVGAAGSVVGAAVVGAAVVGAAVVGAAVAGVVSAGAAAATVVEVEGSVVAVESGLSEPSVEDVISGNGGEQPRSTGDQHEHRQEDEQRCHPWSPCFTTGGHPVTARGAGARR